MGGRLAAAAALCAALCLAAGNASAQLVPETDAVTLVRSVWFEGLPLDRAAQLSEADGVVLAGMLADPAEAAHHANIVMALGACRCGPAYEAVADFDASLQSADPAAVREARFAVPHAMGLLARQDARAMSWLEGQAAEPAPSRSDRPARHRRSAVMRGLALSGSSRAAPLLGQLEADANARGDTGLARKASQARSRAQAGQQ